MSKDYYEVEIGGQALDFVTYILVTHRQGQESLLTLNSPCEFADGKAQSPFEHIQDFPVDVRVATSEHVIVSRMEFHEHSYQLPSSGDQGRFEAKLVLKGHFFE